MCIKNALYDWFGLNQAIQQYFHSFAQFKIYYQTMQFGSNFIGKYELFPLHALIVMLILALIVRKQNALASRSSLTKYHSDIIKTWYVLMISFAINLILVELSKRYFSLPRPLCIDALGHVTISNSCQRSFPSGHSAYITIWVASLWPLMNRTCRNIALFLLFWVCISRLAINKHFPADVLFSVLISGVITLLIRRHIDLVSNRFSSINYHLIKLLTRL